MCFTFTPATMSGSISSSNVGVSSSNVMSLFFPIKGNNSVGIPFQQCPNPLLPPTATIPKRRAIKRSKQLAKRYLRIQKRNKSVSKVKTIVAHNNNSTGIISEQQEQNGWNGWTNEALLDILSFWNIPIQQQHGVAASPNKNIKMIIPQNCCVCCSSTKQEH